MITFLLLVCLVISGFIAADYGTDHRASGLVILGWLMMSAGVAGLGYIAVLALLVSLG